MRFAVRVCLLSVLLTAYASAAATYESGISDHRVEDNLYEVVFKGDVSTSPERVNLLWVYRCAEIAKEQGKAYVSLNDAAGKEIAKAYEMRPRQPGFGSQSWIERPKALSDGVLRPTDRVDFSPVGGHTTIIRNTGAVQTTYRHDGLARLFDDPPPLEAGVTFKAQVLLDELTDYVHGDPNATPPVLQAVLAPARFVTPLGREYALAQQRLRSAATRPSPNAAPANIGTALLHANSAFPGQGSWVLAGQGYVAEGSVVKSDGKSVTFIAALPLEDEHHRFERLHVDCARGTGGVVVGLGGSEKPDVTAAQLAALVDVDAAMSSLDPVHRPLADEACSAAGYALAA